MSLTVAILSFQLYVLSKAWNDSIYIIRKKTTPTHGLEWAQIALVSTIAGMGWHYSLLGAAAFDVLMLPVTWILQDIMLNAFLSENWLTYIGSGEWDLLFKKHWPIHPARAMWAFKLGLLIVCGAAFIWIRWMF